MNIVLHHPSTQPRYIIHHTSQSSIPSQTQRVILVLLLAADGVKATLDRVAGCLDRVAQAGADARDGLADSIAQRAHRVAESGGQAPERGTEGVGDAAKDAFCCRMGVISMCRRWGIRAWLMSGCWKDARTRFLFLLFCHG